MTSKLNSALAILTALLITQAFTKQTTYVRWGRTDYMVGSRYNKNYGYSSPAIGRFQETPSSDTIEFKILASRTGMLYSDYAIISSSNFPKKL